MNLNFYLTKDYENETTFRVRENKPNQTRSEAEMPTGELLGILKPGTNFKPGALSVSSFYFSFFFALTIIWPLRPVVLQLLFQIGVCDECIKF